MSPPNSTEESGLGTAVEVALGATLAVICVFLVAVIFFIKKKKTTDELAVLEMNLSNKSNSNSEGTMATPGRTRMGPGSVAQSTRGSTDDNYRYERIIEILKECDPEDWETYLQAFKKEKLTDEALKLIPCDGGADSEAFWCQLLPQIGVRLAFKKEWKQELQGMESTPGGPGTVIKYAENVELEEAKENVVTDTKDMDTAEPEIECEGNVTGYDGGPALPQGDADGIDSAIEMVYDDEAALPAEPDDVVALQDEPPRPAYAARSGSEPDFKRGVTYDYNGDNLVGDDSDDEENMYKPGRARGQTRGGPGGFEE